MALALVCRPEHRYGPICHSHAGGNPETHRVDPRLRGGDIQGNSVHIFHMPCESHSGRDSQATPPCPHMSFPRRRESILLGLILAQVLPFRVVLFDEPDLPPAVPFLETFLCRQGIADSTEGLKVDQPVHAIMPGEARNHATLVLVYALSQIARHTDVQCAVLFTGHYVHIVALHFHGSWIPAFAGMTCGDGQSPISSP